MRRAELTNAKRSSIVAKHSNRTTPLIQREHFGNLLNSADSLEEEIV